ncbi:hypothetical protein [Flaviaesturariibacter amylovorans]|uniref:Uncharacterized protein n=1 Tax=Flaviaesturariibacter amylovorans TaxID=1084520 RepID=A0ABP8GXQ4_9BACT
MVDKKDEPIDTQEGGADEPKESINDEHRSLWQERPYLPKTRGKDFWERTIGLFNETSDEDL